MMFSNFFWIVTVSMRVVKQSFISTVCVAIQYVWVCLRCCLFDSDICLCCYIMKLSLLDEKNQINKDYRKGLVK